MSRIDRIWQLVETPLKILLSIFMPVAIFTGHIDYAILFTAQLCLLHILDGRAS